MSNAVELAEEYVADSLLYGTAYSDENTYILAQAVIDLSARVEELEKGWQPISTAPKELYILLYCKGGFMSDDQTVEVGTREQWSKTATHWMPLPAPPSAEKIGER